VKPVPNESRHKNVTGEETCRWCADTGYVVVLLRPAKASLWAQQRGIQPSGFYEELAPCPYCEAGFREEFPQPGAKNKHPTSSPWRKDGYWARQSAEFDAPEPQAMYGRPFEPLPAEENKRRMLELAEQISAIGRPMEEER
jgi:hypothetical protein